MARRSHSPTPSARRRALHVKAGDEVVVLAGKDRDKRGKVRKVIARKGRAVVENLQQVKKHLRRSQTQPQGAIVDQDGSIHLSNLMLAAEYDRRHAKPAAATPA